MPRGAKAVGYGRYVALRMTEVAIPRQMFREIPRLIVELRPQRQHETLPASKSNRREESSHSGFRAIQKIATILVSSGFIRGISDICSFHLL